MPALPPTNGFGRQSDLSFDPGPALRIYGTIAFDAAGNAWMANGNRPAVTEFSSTGMALSPTIGFATGGYYSLSTSIAIDGSGNVWSSSENAIVEFSNSGKATSPVNGLLAGFTGLNLYILEWIAVDGSGNVWGASGFSQNRVVEFVGCQHSPVVTPIAAGVANNTLGTRP